MNRRRGLPGRGMGRVARAMLARIAALPGRALVGLRWLGLGRKNRRRISLKRVLEPTRPLQADAPETSAPAPSTSAQPTSGRFGRVGLLLAWLSPLVLAGIAFAMPLIGVRAYEYIMESPYFHVREVVIDQSSTRSSSSTGDAFQPYLSKNEILEVAGIAAGTHLLQADLDAMSARLTAHPWVRWARVERDLPDVLVVHVVERIPSALLAPHLENTEGATVAPQAAPGLYLVDELGHVFTPAPADRVLEVPVVTGVGYERLTDPKASEAVRRELEAGLNVLKLWRSQGLSRRYPVSELRLMPGGAYGVVIELADVGHAGRRGVTEVVLGRGPLREKLLRLEWILEHLHANGKSAEYILLDVVDDLDPRAVALGGASVIVKADLVEDPVEALDALVRRAPTTPPPLRSNDRPSRQRPRQGGASAVTPPAEEPAPGEPAAADPTALEADTPSEVVPLMGGRPAEDFGEE